MKRTLPIVTLALLVGVSTHFALSRSAEAREQVVAPPIPMPAAKSTCTVHLRRDALGVAARTAIPPDAAVVGEGRLALTGLYQGMNDRWVLISRIKDEGRLIWIARDTILSIESVVE